MVLRRLKAEGGFGLVELMIAMTVMAIGITAIVAGFSSGIVALNRASQTSTAGTLADKQMEGYRALAYASVRLTSSPVPATDSVYTSDTAYTCCSIWAVPTDSTCANTKPSCMPVRTQASGLTSPDGRSYRLDTYIAWYCPLGTLGGSASPGPPTCQTAGSSVARAVKQVTVVVRDGVTTSKKYISETSTFDQAT